MDWIEHHLPLQLQARPKRKCNLVVALLLNHESWRVLPDLAQPVQAPARAKVSKQRSTKKKMKTLQLSTPPLTAA
jgi:hypothetical protein